MYLVDENGKKMRQEHYQPPRQPLHQVFHNVRENYSSGSKKCPSWLYWVLGGVALIILILVIVMVVRGQKKKAGYSAGSSMSSGAPARFGFRFY